MIGPGRWPVAWDRAGKYCYIGVKEKTTLAIAVGRGELPKEPAGGFAAWAENAPPGVAVVPMREISPGPDPATFAFIKGTYQTNLFRLSWK